MTVLIDEDYVNSQMANHIGCYFVDYMLHGNVRSALNLLIPHEQLGVPQSAWINQFLPINPPGWF